MMRHQSKTPEGAWTYNARKFQRSHFSEVVFYHGANDILEDRDSQDSKILEVKVTQIKDDQVTLARASLKKEDRINFRLFFYANSTLSYHDAERLEHLQPSSKHSVEEGAICRFKLEQRLWFLEYPKSDGMWWGLFWDEQDLHDYIVRTAT